jgi:Raf kinase inhibitor-like YbhB/YbcL family protein
MIAKGARLWTALRTLVVVGLGLSASTSASSQQLPFQLTSPAFPDNGLMPNKHAGKNPGNPNCVGDNLSPPLQWSNPPDGTRSYALIVHDQEGRYGLGVTHWLAYGIDVSMKELPEGAGDGKFNALIGGSNILGQQTYVGPCPPKGSGLHHYVFTLVATDLEPSALKSGLTQTQLLEAIGSHAKGATGLVGRFGH